MRAPTGEQFEISRSAGGRESWLTITQVAAAIRQFTVDGIDLTEPYPESATPPSAAGIVLVPWPNRVRDGRWLLDGVAQQLALSEPARHNASHGLLRYTPYQLAAFGEGSLTLTATVYPQPGYPFLLDTSVRYDLVDDGLRVEHTLVNAGDSPAPVAVGAHPYLKIGDVDTGELTVTVDAATHFTVDEQLIIVGQEPVDGTPFDLRGGLLVGATKLDDAFADIAFEAGECTHRLSAPDGRSVAVWGDENFRFVQVFTSRAFRTETASDVAVAIEPMTAPSNALNSGTGLRWLSPGETWRAHWGIRHSGF